MRAYCMDTSALIDGWKDYPLENFGVWENIKQLIKKDRFTAPYHVLDELKIGGDDLYHWCSRNNFFCNPTTETPKINNEIKTNYPEFKPKASKSDWADIYVIAIAIEKKLTIVSHETRKTKGKPRYIPDICDEYNIEHVNFLGLIKNEKWKFL